jgi:hypothetical protein
MIVMVHACRITVEIPEGKRPLVRPRSRWEVDIKLDNLCQIPGRSRHFFLFPLASRPALGPTQPPIQRVPEAFSLGVKWPWREAAHSPPSSAEAENEFMAWYLVKHRDNFSFILLLLLLFFFIIVVVVVK